MLRWGLLVAAVAAEGCSAKAPPKDAPQLITGDSGSIVIPAGSPLRSGLVFDTARTTAVSELLVATAAVESAASVTLRVPASVTT